MIEENRRYYTRVGYNYVFLCSRAPIPSNLSPSVWISDQIPIILPIKIDALEKLYLVANACCITENQEPIRQLIQFSDTLLNSALRGSTNIQLTTFLQFLISFLSNNKWFPHLDSVLLSLILCLVFFLHWLLIIAFYLWVCHLWQNNNNSWGDKSVGSSLSFAFHNWTLNAFQRKRTAWWETSTVLMFLRLEEDTVLAWRRWGLAWQRNPCTVTWLTQGHVVQNRTVIQQLVIESDLDLLAITHTWLTPERGDPLICVPWRVQRSQHYKTWEKGRWPGCHPSRHHP